MQRNAIDPYMTTEEAGQYLKVSRTTLRRWADEGRIPAAKIGKEWRFRRSELDAWVAAGGVIAPPLSPAP